MQIAQLQKCYGLTGQGGLLCPESRSSVKVGDLVKIQEVSRSPTDQRLTGVILDHEPYSPASALDRKVEVMWQNGIIGNVPIMRLERINDEDR